MLLKITSTFIWLVGVFITEHLKHLPISRDKMKDETVDITKADDESFFETSQNLECKNQADYV